MSESVAGSVNPVVSADALGPWDRECDVVVVGTGASGLTAGLMAAEGGASVLVLEKDAAPGGTTFKSGGGVWVPNNRYMREHGVVDSRDAALRYMARTARPQSYSPNDPHLGLAPWEYELLEVFYDEGSRAFESLEELGGMQTYPLPDIPNYSSDIAEDELRRGRCMCPRGPDGEPADGPEMLRQLTEALERRGGSVVLEHRATSVAVDGDGAVVGVVAQTPSGTVRIHARRAVIFASGGFTHNVTLRDNYLPGPIFGGCAAHTNTGDFVGIAYALGAAMRNMNQAWNAPVQLERALAGDPTLKSTFNFVGDSLLLVNRYGVRAMNEKAIYHDAIAPMHVWDGAKSEYPNLLMFPVWDERNNTQFAGCAFDGGLIPPAGEDASHVVSGATFEELAARLDERLASLADATGGIRLDATFAERLAATVERFNGFARAGLDEDFGRGGTLVERHMHMLGINAAMQGVRSGSAASAGVASRGWGIEFEAETEEARKNTTMYPLADEGPYYASIVAPGALDTKGGPMTNRHGQVLREDGSAIEGLYAVGNCAASPTGQGYWGAGATLGPMMTYAWLAGQHAARAERPAPAAA